MIRLFFFSVFCLPLSLLSKEVPVFLKNYRQDSYYQMKSGVDVIGRTHQKWRVVGDSLVFDESSDMKMKLYKKMEDVSTRLKVTTDQELRIQKVSFALKASASDMKIEGDRVSEGLKLVIHQMGKTAQMVVPLLEPVITSATMRPYFLKMGLPQSRSELKVQFLELSALTTVAMQAVLVKQASQWTADVTYLSHKMSSLLDGGGNLLRESSEFAGLPVVAEPISLKVYQGDVLTGTREDLVERARVAFPELKAARQLQKFEVLLEGIDLKPFQLNRHRQKLVDNKLSVALETLPQSGLPVEELSKRTALAIYLEPDPMTPVKDPVIRSTAQSIVKDEKDAWKRALLIHDFVYKELVKEPTISVPNALEVLKSKKGDCNEHAALYTALARAAGVPTRTVVGLVYSDRFYGDSGFYYHAWVEVNPGSGWVSLDPTWNQIPSDATHLAFVDGGLDRQIQITSLMGKVKVKPVVP